MTTPIDVWNLATFDKDLLALLQAKGNVLRDYELTSRKNHEEQQAADRWVPLKANPFAADQMHILERIIMPAMEQRTIRAWHYTRLTDAETALLRANGIHMSNMAGIRRRLDAQVAAGTMMADVANAIHGESPFHAQADSRSGKFWMVSHPFAITDGGVELLLQHWGGEGVYFWLKDRAHVELVQSIGRPRVIEVAVPMSATTSAYSAAKAVVATYVTSLGGKPDWSAFDLYATTALGADTVLELHTEGDPNFAAMARSYPAGFIDRD
ncbi:hypothetical protein [Agrobacterium vaccinii]|uniref:hypothetical protein n=1 Tax=Agrobacterium vaccinii TaxID=2735528 RepID=UPI001E54E8AB|nr:hypothetical protein [Agrobacterium vaccinii]UHS59974.1 hypothetical protein HRS00_23945 [Agrobacterium vaccinii]